jgi:hypothetical protein
VILRTGLEKDKMSRNLSKYVFLSLFICLLFLFTCSLSSNNAPTPSNTYSDNFNSASLTQWKVVNGNWLASEGNLVVNSGSAPGAKVIFSPVQGNNFELNVEMKSLYQAKGNIFGILFDYDAANNYQMLQLDPEGNISLRKVAKNGESVIAQGAYQDAGANNWVKIVLRSEVNRLSVKVNGKSVFNQVKSTVSPKGAVGFLADWNVVAVDNFQLAIDKKSGKQQTTFTKNPTTKKATTTRDKFLWPFSSTSPWNMPIGSGARYIPANITKAGYAGADEEYFYKLKSSDPLRPVYAPGSWTKRCADKSTQSMQISLPIPDDLIIPDATTNPYSTPNNVSAFLLPDGKTLVQISPLTRCQRGGAIYGWRYFPNIDIYGQGIGGSHFGSGLSAIGGSIRKGELTNNEPIRHALKILIFAEKYLYYSQARPGYRWPADRADNYAAQRYHGKNPSLLQGSLLAIPPKVTVNSLKLQTTAGKKLFRALQDYGGYVVDDAAWDAHYLAVEKGVLEEFAASYGYNFSDKNGAFYDDFMKLFPALQIVDNNTPKSVGGGGKRRVPLAPPIGN